MSETFVSVLVLAAIAVLLWTHTLVDAFEILILLALYIVIALFILMTIARITGWPI